MAEPGLHPEPMNSPTRVIPEQHLVSPQIQDNLKKWEEDHSPQQGTMNLLIWFLISMIFKGPLWKKVLNPS